MPKRGKTIVFKPRKGGINMNVNVDIAYQNTINLNERLLEIAKENGVDTKEIEENIAKAKAMYADFLKGVEE